MLKYTKTDYVPSLEFKALMRRHLNLYMDYNKLKYDIMYDNGILNNLFKQISNYIEFFSDYKIEKYTANEICPFLVKYEKVPENLIMKIGKKGPIYSLDKTIREKLNSYNYVPELMDLINAYTEIDTSVDIGRSLLRALIKTDLISNCGDEIYSAPFSYKESDTFRVYTSDISATTIPIKYVKHITSPKDYLLLWCDFAQIDLRCAWNMILRYNNEQSANIDINSDTIDFYKLVAQDVSLTNKRNFSEEKFKEDRHKYKRIILSTINGASVQALINDIKDKVFSENLYNYINTQNKAYVEYKETINNNIASKVNFYMQTYFGTKMYIPFDGLDKDICTASLNRPLQGTSADIQKLVTVDIYNKMQSLINDPTKFFPILNRHDETLWYIHKECLPFLNEFNSMCKIQIDDWDLIELEWEIGYNYKTPITDIKNKYINNSEEKFIKSNEILPKPFLQPIPLVTFYCQEKIEDYNLYIISLDWDNLIFDVYKGDTNKATEKFLNNLFNKHLKNKEFTRLILHGNREGYLNFNDKEIIFSTENNNTKFLYSCRYIMNRYIERVLKLKKTLDLITSEVFKFTHQNKYYYEEGIPWK